MMTCELCPLHESAQTVKVRARGSDKPKILIVGEAPGREEDQMGEAFVGPAGKFQDTVLKKVGINKKYVRFDNVVKCFPQKVRKHCTTCGIVESSDDGFCPTCKMPVVIDKRAGGRAPSDHEIMSCTPYLWRDIVELDPKLIITAGAPATHAFLGKKAGKITDLSGEVFMVNVGGKDYPVIPCVHPSAYLRSGRDSYSDKIHSALARAKSFLHGDKFRKDLKWECLNDTEEAVSYLMDLKGRYLRGEVRDVVYDIESIGYDLFLPNTAFLGLGLCTEEAGGVFIPAWHRESKVDTTRLVAALQDFFSSVPVIAHNAIFECSNTPAIGAYPKASFDTMLASSVLYAGKHSHTLEALCQDYLKLPPWKWIIDSEIRRVKGSNYGDASLDVLAEYCVHDCTNTLKLKRIFEPLLKETGLQFVFDMLIESVNVFSGIMQRGLFVNLDYLFERIDSYQKEIDECLVSLRNLPVVRRFDGVWKKLSKNKKFEAFNPNSPDQVRHILFEMLKLPVQGLTGTDRASTDEETCVALYNLCRSRPEVPQLQEALGFMRLLLKIKKIGKVVSSYFNKALLCQRGRGSYNISCQYILYTENGRFRTNNFAIQTAPKKSDVRRMFVSEWHNNGGLILGADYSQIEVRVLAAVSMDESLINAYKEDVDVHRFVASRINKIPEDQVTDAQRQGAKSVVFGTIYGRGAKSVHEETGMPLREAENLQAELFSMFPGIGSYVKNTHKFLRKNCFVQIPSGRIRWLEKIRSKDKRERSEALREGQNGPIQGCASDMTLRALLCAYRKMEEESLRSKIFLFFHDYIGVDVYPGEIHRCYEILKWAMEEEVLRYFEWFKVPVKADFEIGSRWGTELKMSPYSSGYLVKGKVPHFKEFVQFAKRAYNVEMKVLEVVDKEDPLEDSLITGAWVGDTGGTKECKAFVLLG